jgi:hypothetical protein
MQRSIFPSINANLISIQILHPQTPQCITDWLVPHLGLSTKRVPSQSITQKFLAPGRRIKLCICQTFCRKNDRACSFCSGFCWVGISRQSSLVFAFVVCYDNEFGGEAAGARLESGTLSVYTALDHCNWSAMDAVCFISDQRNQKRKRGEWQLVNWIAIRTLVSTLIVIFQQLLARLMKPRRRSLCATVSTGQSLWRRQGVIESD